MSQYQDGQDITLSVSEDLSAKAYHAMKIGASDNTALVNDSAGGTVIGVLQEKVDGSTNVKPARIRISGNTKVKCGGTCTRGNFGTSDTNGKFVNSTGSNKHAYVLFLESGVTNDIISAVIVNYKTDA